MSDSATHAPGASRQFSSTAEISLGSFDFQPTTRVVFGPGCLDQLGELARGLGSRRVLVVTDRGIRSAGHADRGATALAKAGLEPVIFDAVEENPTTKHVGWCVEAARKANVDLIVGLGGGSSMDTAKGANFILTNGGKMADYWGVGKASKPMLPMIAVPTTAGTGSEAQSFALIADEHTHQKMACGDKKAACRIAVLDPEVTVSQPPRVTAVCGIDAVAHALESFVTTQRNPISHLYAAEAWRLLEPALPIVLSDPTDLDARGKMLLGANFAGSAIENSMLGATHSAANPLTAHFGITHGVAIGIMLPHVLRFNSATSDRLYVELLDDGVGSDMPGEWLANRVRELRNQTALLPQTLNECGVDRAKIPQMAAEAAKQWTAKFNPRPPSIDDFIELYERAFHDE